MNIWWAKKVKTEERWSLVLEYVKELEQRQKPMHERNLRYARLYDRNCRLMGANGEIQEPIFGDPVTDNLVASNIDTATAEIASNKPRIAIITSGAEWSVQRRAKWLERYIEAQFQRTDLYTQMVDVFRDACVFGTGALKVYIEDEQIVAQRTIPDELIVDEEECRAAPPRQLHQRRFVDREVMKALYPDFEAQIDAAHEKGAARKWTSYRSMQESQLAVIESWHLPSTRKAEDGIHTISIDGATILEEPYKRRTFPFIFVRWSKRITGFYGQGLAEQLCGSQLTVNRLNGDIKKGHRLIAVPRVWVHHQDAAMKLRIDDEIGAVGSYKVKPPVATTWQAFGPETYNYLERVKRDAQRYIGISEMSAQAKKPVGLDSGAALREWNDINAQRLSIQKQDLEHSYLEASRHFVELSKELHSGEVDVSEMWHTRNLAKRIPWKDVVIEEDIYSMRIEAASILSLTPAGRRQAATDLVQTGMLRPEAGLRLMGIPDVERELDIMTAGIEDIEAEIEDLLEGKYRTPEPFQALGLGIERVQLAALKARRDGAPEDILELMRKWIENAVDMVGEGAQQPATPQQSVVDPAAGLAAPAGAPMPAPPAAASAPPMAA